MFCKNGVLRNFVKFTGKHLERDSFLITLQASDLQLYQKNSIWHRCFPVNFAKFLRTPFFCRPHLLAASVSISINNETHANKNLRCDQVQYQPFSTSELLNTSSDRTRSYIKQEFDSSPLVFFQQKLNLNFII